MIYRLRKAEYKQLEYKFSTVSFSLSEFPGKAVARGDEGSYRFLNVEARPEGWNDASHGMLWAYNLNYMDYLLQPGISAGEGYALIRKFIDELPSNRVGLDPYPIALRGINWIKWLAINGSSLTDAQFSKVNNSLYSQYKLLERKLEYHLMGNHLLEDAYSLVIAAVYFSDQRMWRKANKLLLHQLKEQVLPDGAHYEQSPMYHCILLDRLLDCYNVSVNNRRFPGQEELNVALYKKAAEMLGHLEAIVWADGDIPMLNDSAHGIAPTPDEIFSYARRLGLRWHPMDLCECGYRKLQSQRMEAIVDVGGITASYQPGHTHADTFNYELRVDGHPFIVDTGISTYDKTPRRQYERGTSAHNTVTVSDRDSSEVWGGFRVGSRANVTILDESFDSVSASHDGYKPIVVTRRFELTADGFGVTDTLSSPAAAKSYIHFAPGIKINDFNNSMIFTDEAIIEISGASIVEIADCTVSREYNRFMEAKMAVIHFDSTCHYSIKSPKK